MNISFSYSERAKVATALRIAGYVPSAKNVDGVLAELVGHMETESFPDIIKNIPSIAATADLKRTLSPEAVEMIAQLKDGWDYYNVLDGRTMRSYLPCEDPEVLYGAVLPLKDACALAVTPDVESFDDICDAAEGHYFNIWSVVEEYKPDEVAGLVTSVVTEPGWVVGTKDNVLAAGIARRGELSEGMSAASLSDFIPRLDARGITISDRYGIGLDDPTSEGAVYNVLTKTIARVNSRRTIRGNMTISTWTFPTEGPRPWYGEWQEKQGGQLTNFYRSMEDEPGWGPCSKERVDASFAAALDEYPEDRRADERWKEERCPTYLTHGYLARDEEGSGIIGAVYELEDGGYNYCLAYGDASAPLVREDDISETRHADTLDGARLGLVELGATLAVSVKLATTEKEKAVVPLSSSETFARLEAAVMHAAAGTVAKVNTTTHKNITR